MASPKFNPVVVIDRPRAYASPDHVPDSWDPDRPGEIDGFQPVGDRLGAPGPDQGYAIKLAYQLADRLYLADGEHVDDVVQGCLGLATRRASLFSRAPVVHDLHVAFTLWGFYDESPSPDLVSVRRARFEGLRHVDHHYSAAREIVDAVDSEVLLRTPAEVHVAYDADWRFLLGL